MGGISLRDTARLARGRINPPPWTPTMSAAELRAMSRSESRKRTKMLPTRWTPAEHEQLSQRARRAGLSRAAFIRLKTLGDEGARSQKRPSKERRDLAQLLGELGKIGSNINQIARHLNSGGDMQRQFAEQLVTAIRAIQQKVRDAFDNTR